MCKLYFILKAALGVKTLSLNLCWFFRLNMPLKDVYQTFSTVNKFGIAFVIVLVFIFDITSLVLINRTKRTFKNTRFLTTSLVGFDGLSTVALFFRLFVNNVDILIRLREVGFYCLLFVYVTVFMMCVEQLILITAPTKYMMYFRYASVKRFAVGTWLSMFGGVVTTQWVKCGLRFHITPDYFACQTIVFKMSSILIFVINIASGAIYIKIIQTIWSIYRRYRTMGSYWTGQKYIRPPLHLRNTKLVFAYFITLTSMIIILLMWYVFGKTDETLRLAIDVTIMLSAIVDPCLYVFWFKESRFELLKLLSVCKPSLRSKIEPMRIEVFNIIIPWIFATFN